MKPEDKLARMANQIAGFFRSYPEEQAVSGVQDHIVSFWSPVMRRDLAKAIENDGVTLDPYVRAAFQRMATGESPTHKVVEGPAEVGEMASDAG